MENFTTEELFGTITAIKSYRELEKFYLIDIVSLRNSKNQTLLHIAAGFGRADIVSYFLERGIDVNAQDNNGQTALHSACNHGHFKTASCLIRAGAEVDIADKEKGWTPLHFALARKDNENKIDPKYWKVIELLIDSGADLYLKTTSGKTCLDRIKDSDDRRAVRLAYIFNKLKSCDNQSREGIIDRFIKIEDFFELVKLGDDNLQVLNLLTTSNLINSRLIDCDNITPLHRAAGYNHIGVAQLFIHKGAQVDATDRFGRIPLHNAAQYGHVEMIDLLVNANSYINKQDLMGYSPLHVAASNRTFTACLKLIELGANINLICHKGKIPYDLAEYDDVKEVLQPNDLRHRSKVIPSSTDQGIYYDIQMSGALQRQEPARYSSLTDRLMLDSSSEEPLFTDHRYMLKKQTLDKNDERYQEIRQRMLNSIVVHDNDSGGRFSSYDIISIERILNQKVWSKYRLKCASLEHDYPKNEKLLFHGSNIVDRILKEGIDERYAHRDGMYGAGIYFAEHSSKSNQYTIPKTGCKDHNDKSCYKCERKMIYAQVALGRSLLSKEAMPKCAHAPPGYSSVTGSPEFTDNLQYPEYVVYSGDQTYPLFVITYRIKL